MTLNQHHRRSSARVEGLLGKKHDWRCGWINNTANRYRSTPWPGGFFLSVECSVASFGLWGADEERWREGSVKGYSEVLEGGVKEGVTFLAVGTLANTVKSGYRRSVKVDVLLRW